MMKWDRVQFLLQKMVYYAFIDLEKVFDRAYRKVNRWALRKVTIEERLASAVTAIYEGYQIVVNIIEEVSTASMWRENYIMDTELVA